MRPPFDATLQSCDQLWDVASLEPTDQEIRARAYYLWIAAGRPLGTAEANWDEARSALMLAKARLLRHDLP